MCWICYASSMLLLSGLCGALVAQVIEERDENAGRQEAYQIFQVHQVGAEKPFGFRRADRYIPPLKTGSQRGHLTFVAWKIQALNLVSYIKGIEKAIIGGDFNCSC